jgi:hypothetical protein
MCGSLVLNMYLSLIHSSPQSKALTLPTWASLARDYLAIMATSVPSERAFSSAGITITKRRNRLKGDIVEALQVLKGAHREDLFPEYPSATLEERLVKEGDAEDKEAVEAVTTTSSSWDNQIFLKYFLWHTNNYSRASTWWIYFL